MYRDYQDITDKKNAQIYISQFPSHSKMSGDVMTLLGTEKELRLKGILHKKQEEDNRLRQKIHKKIEKKNESLYDYDKLDRLLWEYEMRDNKMQLNCLLLDNLNVKKRRIKALTNRKEAEFPSHVYPELTDRTFAIKKHEVKRASIHDPGYNESTPGFS